MCECSWQTCAPTVEQRIVIRHCFNHKRWVAEVQVIAHDVEQKTIFLSSGSHEFGPFDSSTEVGYWLSGQSRVLRVMAGSETMEKLC